jgi:hypothetical protein
MLRGLDRLCAALVVLLAVGCDEVRQWKTTEAVGSLTVENACTSRRPWLPDSGEDIKCIKTLHAADGRLLDSQIEVATLDPTGRMVAASSAYRVSLYDATSGERLGTRDLPFTWSYPSWSPDATAFVPWGGGFSRGFFVADVPFQPELTLVDADYGSSEYAWSPSGKRLGYVVSTENPGGHGKAELWVWDRATHAKTKVGERTFVSWATFTARPGWISEEAHLCSEYFTDPDPACSQATRTER